MSIGKIIFFVSTTSVWCSTKGTAIQNEPHRAMFTMQTSFLEITFLTASVTRLDCRINGNFSIKRIGQKYIDSEFVNHNQKSFKECAVLCTTTDQCHFFNLNSRTSLCQIYLTSDYGFLEEKLVNDSDWIFGATDFSRKLRGPKCKTEKPCSHHREICYDACNVNGYSCIDHLDLRFADGVTITASNGGDASYFLVYSADLNFRAGIASEKIWVRINFPTPYEIEMFWIGMQQPVPISISIGNSTTIAENLFCVKIPAHILVYNQYKYIECSFPRKYIGKYIILNNEDVESGSDVAILFSLIHISGHL